VVPPIDNTMIIDGVMHVGPAPSGAMQKANRAFKRRDAWRSLRPLLTPFYRAGIPYDLSGGGRSNANLIVRRGFSATCPSHVRINGKFVSLLELLRQIPVEATGRPEWIAHVPIPKYWLRTLLAVDSQHVPTMLATLAHRTISLAGPNARLSGPLIQRIIGIVRRTKDHAVLGTALIALLGSQFLGVADDDTVLTLIEADAFHFDVAKRLFVRSPETTSRLLKIAGAIVEDRVKASRDTRVAAAKYLAENAVFSQPPLRSIEPLYKGLGSAQGEA
jgi:hypothetical protein